MKLKFSLYLLLATLFMGFAFVSCEEPTDDLNDAIEQIVKDPFTLEITGSTIDDLGVKVSINSGVDVSNYVVGIAAKNELASIASDSVKVATYIAEQLADKDIDFAKVDDTYVFKGDAEVDLASAWELKFGTDYVIGAFAVSADGAVLSGVNLIEASTEAEPFIEEPFALNVTDSSAGDVAFEFEVNQEIEYYYLSAVATKELTGNYEGDAEAYIAEVIAKSAEVSSDLDELADQGLVYTVSSAFQLSALVDLVEVDTEYSLIAVAVNAEGARRTEVVTFTASTTDASGEAAFELNLHDVTTDSALLDIKTQYNCGNYFLLCQPSEMLDMCQGDHEVLINAMIQSSIMTGMGDFTETNDINIFNGDKEGIDPSMAMGGYFEPGQNYTIVVAGVDATGALTTSIAYEDFSTGVDKVEDAFDFEIASTEQFEITVDFSVDSDVQYYYLIAYAQQAYNMGGADPEFFMESKILESNNYSKNLEEQVAAGYAFKASGEFKLSNLLKTGVDVYADNNYIFIAVGVAASGEYMTDVEVFDARTAKPLPSNAFALEAHDVTSSSAMVNITPTSEVENYYVICRPNSEVQDYSNGDYAAFYATGVESAVMMGTDFSTPDDNFCIYTGAKDVDLSACCGAELIPETVYSLIVAGVDAKGALTTQISYLNVGIPAEGAEETEPLTLELAELSAQDIQVTVTPSFTVPYYFVSIITTDALAMNYGGDAEAYAKSTFAYESKWFDIPTMMSNGYFFEGEQTVSARATQFGRPLTTGSEYQFIVLGVDAALNPISSAVLVATPGEEVVVDPFTLNLAETTDTDVKVTVTPSTAVPYYFATVVPKDVVDNNYGGDIDTYVKETYAYEAQWFDIMTMMFNGYLFQGEQTVSGSALLMGRPMTAGLEYYFAVLGVDGSKNTLTSDSILVTPGSAAAADPFSFEVADLTMNSVSINVTPDASVSYYSFAYAPDFGLESMGQTIEEFAIASAEGYLSSTTPLDVLVMGGMISNTAKSFAYSSLKAETGYEFALVPISADRTVIKDKIMTGSFVTPGEAAASAEAFTFAFSDDPVVADTEVVVTPSSDVAYYYAYGTLKSMVDSDYDGDMTGLLKEGANRWLSQTGGNPSILIAPGLLFEGEHTFKLMDLCGTLATGKEYCVGAIAIAANGTILDDVKIVNFTPVE